MELEPRIKDRPQSHIDEKIQRWSKSKGELISTWKVLSSWHSLFPIFLHEDMNMCVYVCVYVCIYGMYVCMTVYMCVFVCMCVHICMCVCMYMCCIYVPVKAIDWCWVSSVILRFIFETASHWTWASEFSLFCCPVSSGDLPISTPYTFRCYRYIQQLAFCRTW